MEYTVNSSAFPATARTSFVGRRDEAALIARLLDESQLVTLTGVGGVGKTRLAVHVMQRWSELHDGEVGFIGLDAVENSARLPAVFVRSLGIPDQSVRPPKEATIDYLADRDVLLIVDNCEHVLEGAAVLIDEMLSALPRLKILATSRSALEIEGEQIFAVPPMALPSDAADFDAATQADAVALLVSRARSGNPGFAPSPSDLPELIALCAALDGLPLAIELAATRLRSLSIHDLLVRLEHRFELLGTGSVTANPRQRTLRAMVDWSDELCSPQQRRLWSALSVFVSTFTIDAAAAVAVGPELTSIELPLVLDELIAQSLLIVVEGEAGHYRMLETIRAYGRERALTYGESNGYRKRHLDYFRGVASRVSDNWYGPGQSAALAELRSHHADLQAALDYAVTDEVDPDIALHLVADLRFHWAAGGFLAEGRRWADRALARSGASPQPRAATLLVGAWVSLLQGDIAAAEHRLAEVEGWLGQADDDTRQVASTAALWRGTWHLFAGDAASAGECFERSIEMSSDAGRTADTLLPSFQLAIARAQLGDPEAAEPARRAANFCQLHGERWMYSHAVWALGVAALSAGELTLADELGREAIAIQREFNDYIGSCLMLEHLALVAVTSGDAEHSAKLTGAVGAQWRRIGSGIRFFGSLLASQHDTCVRLQEEALGRPTVIRLWAAGEQLSLHEAIELALREPADRNQGLSDRELEIAEKVYLGLSNKQIAAALFISPRTVDSHVQRILSKLGFATRAQIAVWYSKR